MIPKTLVYCNFGHMNMRPEIEQECMKTWEKIFPKTEWHWIELNETNFDYEKYYYTKIAYKKKLYNLVSDYARLYYIYHNGGVYVDTDYYAIQSLDQEILNNKMFIGSTEIKSNTTNYVSWGIFGAEKNNLFIYNILQDYNSINTELSINNSILLEADIYKHLLQQNISHSDLSQANIITRENITIYPFNYFTNINYKAILKIFNMDNVKYGIHLYAQSWHLIGKIKEKIIKEYIQKIKNKEV